MKNTFHILIICLLSLAVTSCSTKKNTAMNRFWHSFTARYNTYYNGTLAYIDASLEKENGNKDNFTELLPLYTIGNKASRDLGKSNYDLAITKSKKVIQLHSIKAKPEWNKDRKKTEKEIEWLSRKEYNPFMWRAWMLMGRSQFYKGDFDEAASTFAYMARMYKGQPSIYGKARAWLAKCYIENDWIYDAEDVIRNIERDSIHWKAQKEWDYTYADYYLHSGNMPKAAEYLRKVIKHEMRSKQRAREYYLLGQIEAAMGHKQEAYHAFKKVIAQNPPYEVDFNARISMTEVMAQGQAKKMIGRLKRMARNDNNKDYLDQVYYAIGNIYLAEKDTANAIAAYEKGNEKATRTGIEKGVLLLHLGDLYWQIEKYGDAQRCYGAAIGMLDKERPDYKQLSERSKILDELVPFTDAIHLQDSLQSLAKMDEKERNEAIDRVIEALKKKEKEEQAKAAETELEKRQQLYGATNKSKQPAAPVMPTIGPQSKLWYFYNPTTVQQGKQAFQRLWGKRENADNWQRMNKTVVGSFDSDSNNNDITEADSLLEEQRDSIATIAEEKEKKDAKPDSAVNDPHKREYYLAQIPFSEEDLAASNEIIKDGLIKSGIIFKDKLDNLVLSEKQFTRLMKDYPNFEPKDEVFYHMFLLHSRKSEFPIAKSYIDSLATRCPDSKWTAILTDPYFEDNAKFGKHLEDSIYGATYEAFKSDRFQEVYDNARISETRFPLGDNRDRFIFLNGMTRLNDGDPDSCMRCMERIIKEYPSSVVAEMAGMIINGVKQGKTMHGSKFDLSNVWDRRNMTMTEGDSVSTRNFSTERFTDYLFIIAYPADSVNENRLLFELARYNFTNFMVRNFDLHIEESMGMHHMTVSGFRNFNEAKQYARLLLKQESVTRTMRNARPIVISEENLQLIGGRYSYNDYDSFYVENFAPLMVDNPEQLYEPVSVAEGESTDDNDRITPALPTDEVAPGGAKPIEKSDSDEPSDSDELMDVPADMEIEVPVGIEIATPTETETTIPQEEFDVPAEDVAKPAEETFDVPAEEAAKPAEETFDVPVEEAAKPAEETFDVPVEEAAKPAEETFDVPVEEAAKPAEETFDVPTEEAAKPAEETFDVPVEEAAKPAEETFDIPTEEAAKPEEETFDVPAEEVVKPAEETFDVPVEEVTKPEEETFDIPTDEPAKAEEEFIILDDSENKKSDDEEEYILIDEKQSTEDLEDEYYELDGF